MKHSIEEVMSSLTNKTHNKLYTLALGTRSKRTIRVWMQLRPGYHEVVKNPRFVTVLHTFRWRPCGPPEFPDHVQPNQHLAYCLNFMFLLSN